MSSSILVALASKYGSTQFDPVKLRFPDSLIASLPASPIHNAPPSDVRDWVAIRTWASDLVTKLQPQVA